MDVELDDEVVAAALAELLRTRPRSRFNPLAALGPTVERLRTDRGAAFKVTFAERGWQCVVVVRGGPIVE